MDDIVREFLIESNESLDWLDRNLVELEKSPRNQELLADIFRTIHSIKGTTGFLGFHRLEAVAHAGENLLSRLRDGLLVLSPEITTGLLAMVDVIREMLASIESTEVDAGNNYPEVIATLEQLESPEIGIAISTVPDKDGAPRLGELLSRQGIVTEAELAAALQKQSLGDPRKLGEILMEEAYAKPVDILTALTTQQAIREQSIGEGSIRVDVSLLEHLTDLIGELELSCDQVKQFAGTQTDRFFLNASQKLNLLTSTMRKILMQTRLQPIQNVMGKFPRMVRDLGLACGKQVRIEIAGGETELDRMVLEAIKDPLTHAVRNSIDHGIETPEVRLAAGKTADGVLRLNAYQAGGHVNIEVSDDGAGIDPDRIRVKALEKQLITIQQADRMRSHEIINLIFVPGFSTAEKVTNVSGRGVGMDVIRTNIEKVGGAVEIQSVLGQGSTVRMRIPIMPGNRPASVPRIQPGIGSSTEGESSRQPVHLYSREPPAHV